MSWFQSTHHERISSTIPTDVDPAAVVEFLQDHESLVRMNPMVVKFEHMKLADDAFLAAELQSKDALAYRVYEKSPFGEVIAPCSFLKTPDGVDMVIDAPLGMKVWLSSRVVRLPDNSTWSVLREDVTIQVNRFLMPFIVWKFKSDHVALHERILKLLANSCHGGMND